MIPKYPPAESEAKADDAGPVESPAYSLRERIVDGIGCLFTAAVCLVVLIGVLAASPS